MSTVKPLGPLAAELVVPSGVHASGPAAPAAGAGAVAADPVRALLSQLAAGQISGAEAIAQIASTVSSQSGASAAGRAAVEQRVRALMETDPTIALLLSKVSPG